MVTVEGTVLSPRTVVTSVPYAIRSTVAAKVGGSLYADGLGEGDAATYEGMYRHNIATIVDALK